MSQPIKALIVVTSHGSLGASGQATGYYLPEVTHPYYALVDAGFEVDIASIQGGAAPMDPKSHDLQDPANERFLETPADARKLQETLALDMVDPGQYRAILFAGGHGTMWDFPGSKAAQSAARAIYESGGVLAAVCHGPAALVDMRLSNGDYLVRGKRVSTFTDEEETAVKLAEVVPFLLESRLRERGAIIEKAAPWQEQVSVEGRLVTGQNPASAHALGKEVARLLKEQEQEASARCNDVAAALHSADQREQLLALAKIAARRLIEHHDAVAGLMLSSEIATVRARAAWALGNLGDRRATAALLQALHDPEWLVRSSAGWALVHLGPEVRSEVEHLAEHTSSEDAREMAHLVLERLPAR